MRGLDIRVEMANARVLAVLDLDAGNDKIVGLMFRARGMGAADYRNGLYRVPSMFVGDAPLTDWWVDGQESAARLAKRSHCSGCKNRWGHPCSMHG